MSVSIDISIGELHDRHSILRLKEEHCTDPAARERISKEVHRLSPHVDWRDPYLALHHTNRQLWNLEDEVRCLMAAGDYGPRYVHVTRTIHEKNDERHRIKKRIDAERGSLQHSEVKIYSERIGNKSHDT
jgi:hypothetical protein